MIRRFKFPLVVACVLGGAVAAQQVTLVRVFDSETAPPGGPGPWSLLGEPALAGGELALVGVERDTGSRYVLRTTADGLGELVVVAATGELIPGTGDTFAFFADPALATDGQVAFGGGTTFEWSDGVYLGEGGPLAVVVDQTTSGPPPVRYQEPDFDGARVAYGVGERDGAAEVRVADLAGVETTIAAAGEAAPGGGTFVVVYPPSIAAGQVVFAGFLDGLADPFGIYRHDVTSGVLELVANATTPVPGAESTFALLLDPETDGTEVAFTGYGGFVPFGDHGVYAGPLGGALRVVADRSTVIPGVRSGLQRSFDAVSIDAGLTAFECRDNSGAGVYARFTEGPVVELLTDDAVLEGVEVIGVELDRRAVSGRSVALGVRFADGTSAVYVATVEPFALEAPPTLVSGQPFALTARHAFPGETVIFLLTATGVGDGPEPPQLGGLGLDLLPPIQVLGSAVADAGGTAVLTATVPATAPPPDRVWLQAVAQRGPSNRASNKTNAADSAVTRSAGHR